MRPQPYMHRVAHAALLLFHLLAVRGHGSGPPPVAPPGKLSPAADSGLAQGYLETGRLYRIGGIAVEGLADLPPEALGLAAYQGQPATSARIRELAEVLKTYLLDHGRPFAMADFDISVRKDPGLVDIRIRIEGGPGFKYGGTKQAGSRTQPQVLERLRLLTYGEDYNEARIRQADRRLERTGYYEFVIPGTLFRDSTRNLLYPTLALADRKGNRLGGILGFDSERQGGGGLNGYLDIHLINLRGTARDLDFSFAAKSPATGPQQKDARLSYTEPWILGAAAGAKVSLDLSIQDSVYTESNEEIQLFQDLGFRSRYSVSFAHQYNQDYLADLASTAFKTGIGTAFDARDRVPGTLRGSQAGIQANWLRRELADTSYHLAQGKINAALWGNRGRWVGHVSGLAGGNWPLSEGANRGDLHTLGGANSIRGYREKEFLTDLYLYGNLEAQFLLSPQSRGSVFVIPGLVNLPGGDVHWRRVLGYGLGLEAGGRDWAFGVSYALNPSRSLGNGFVHLSVTNNF